MPEKLEVLTGFHVSVSAVTYFLGFFSVVGLDGALTDFLLSLSLVFLSIFAMIDEITPGYYEYSGDTMSTVLLPFFIVPTFEAQLLHDKQIT